ncbi:MAG: TIGR00282 family metallophosphoesterase [Parcubacteria group bacterium CG08_land_8_20_14_0_20_38_56]|nr:MAG: TIGR00282 family metallophosphoesterase [Parcubacteria group bacterium CG08_land_8_20_14_0_20_38_56]
MRILFFGDIFGRPGREALKLILPKLREKYEPDFVIANGENSAHGKGITEKSLKEILEAGVDLITTGDHAFEIKGSLEIFSQKEIPVLRPANFPKEVPGQGWKLLEVRTKKILVLNLLGRVFIRCQLDDPFRLAKKIIKENKDEVKIILVDWHCEATAEKKALGLYLDGEVSAVLGTHTHVPTADERILPRGTAYITDLGMVGPHNSIIGAKEEEVMKGFLKQLPFVLEPAEGPVEVNGVFLEIDNKTGLAKKIERIREIVEP